MRIEEEKGKEKEEQEQEQEACSSTRKSYTAKHNNVLNPRRLSEDPHIPFVIENRQECAFCKDMCIKEDKVMSRQQTTVVCKVCAVVLCFRPDRSCYADYHTLRSP